MSKSLKGTETLGNLMKAFAGESQARSRYTMYAGVARKEGYRQIEGVFLETADHEAAHAKRFFKHIQQNMPENEPLEVLVDAEYPVVLGDTLTNLNASAAGENEEQTSMYPGFADVAQSEGFPQIAAQFRNTAIAEAYHEDRFRQIAAELEAGTVFKKGNKVIWKCRNCGFIHEAEAAPEVCPACAHKKEFFEVLSESF